MSARQWAGVSVVKGHIQETHYLTSNEMHESLLLLSPKLWLQGQIPIHFVCCSSDSCLSPVLFSLQCILDVTKSAHSAAFKSNLCHVTSVWSPVWKAFINVWDYVLFITRMHVHTHTLTLRKQERSAHENEVAASIRGVCSWKWQTDFNRWGVFLWEPQLLC